MRERLERLIRHSIFGFRRLQRTTGVSPGFPPQVTARAVCCLTTSGAETVWKHADTLAPPASLAKLATALVLTRGMRSRLGESIEIERRDCVTGSSASLRPGDLVTWSDLLHGLLLPSGNDAAQAIARQVGHELLQQERRESDPVQRFVNAMNDLCAQLGLSRTRFTNPTGLDDTHQYSTARELAILASAAFSDPLLQMISGRSTYRINAGGNSPRTIRITSTVSMLGEPGVVCGKTGSTRAAKACLALWARVGGEQITMVLLGSQVRFTSGGKVVEESDRRFDDAHTLLTHIRQSRGRAPMIGPARKEIGLPHPSQASPERYQHSGKRESRVCPEFANRDSFESELFLAN